MNREHRSLEGKVALITGAGRGVGREVALGLVREGASIVAVARTLSQVEAVVQEAATLNAGLGVAVQADVTNQQDIERMVERVAQHYGRIDILVNNVGGGVYALARTDPEAAAHLRSSFGYPFWELPVEYWHRILALDLTSHFLCSRTVTARFFLAQGSGSIINVTSIQGDQPYPLFSAYGAAKAGLNHLTRIMALELRDYNIAVNAIRLPFLKTSVTEGTLLDGWKDEPRYRPEVAVPVVNFLARQEARTLTGQIIDCLQWLEENGFGPLEQWRC